MGLRAILLDFDGVLADTEPIHFAMFREVLKQEGVTLSKSLYYEKYLGLDDRSCFAAVYKDQGRRLDAATKERLIQNKNKALLEFVDGRPVLLPGVKAFVEKMNQNYFLAIVSGALKSEITAILDGAGLRDKFHVIVAADDVAQGKPDPEGFLTAIRLLNRDFIPSSEVLFGSECLAIEDSPWGIEAAHRAGSRCLGVLTSYPKGRLHEADLLFHDLDSVDWKTVETLFS